MPDHDAAEAPEGLGHGSRVVRCAALFVWSACVWLLLTWSTMLEQLVAGAAICLVVSVGLTSLGPVARPWRFLHPRTVVAVLHLAVSALVRIVRANFSLARRIWSPGRPLASGMVIVPTTMCSEGGLAGMGLISSLIVDNQIVDLDREHYVVQFHAIDVPTGLASKVRAINGPIEDLLRPITEIRHE